MRPLFRGEGCAINEAGISSAGNPLARALDAVTNDHMGARQMREGYLAAGMRPPMGAMGPQGHMLDPMCGPAGSVFDDAWRDVGGMVRPPMLGAAMPDQLAQHMQRAMGPEMREAGFFTDGPVSMPGRPWADGAGMMMQRPPGPQDWAGEFAMRPMAAGPSPMEAAFQEAQMRQGRAAEMEAAFKSAEAATGPMGPMLGPMGPLGPMLGGPMMAPMGMLGGMCGPMMAPSAPLIAPAPAMATSAAPVAAEAAPVVAEAAPVDPEMAALQEQVDRTQAAQMVEMLRNSGNPKFMNSQFVSFIDKVSKGDLQFKENTVVDRTGREVDWDELYDTNVASFSPQEHQDLQRIAEFTRGNLGPMDMEARMEQEWEAAAQMADINDMDFERWLDMNPAFANMQGLSEGPLPAPQYTFVEETNPYLDHDNPLAEALRLIREGRDREALVYLEAEVRRNPESSEGWRVLGELYAAFDQDPEAIQCLRKGHEVDPYNLDSLLALGVSCTNELHQLDALRHLRRWLENHEEYQGLAQAAVPPSDYEYEAWREQVTGLFKRAAETNPLDSQVFVALGVLENISRNYKAASASLATACRLRPNDHTVWNKLGATLANSGNSEQALISYHQGLQLKPNYARGWSNLAIAHQNLGQHADAARFYLSALVLNPEATHLWNFLHSAVLNMDASTEQMRAIDDKDLEAARRLFDGVLDPASLPKPAAELPQAPDEILSSMGL